MIDVFDFFSGCGGTSLGFQNQGFNIIGGLDFDKDCAQTFTKNFPSSHFIQGDIRTIKNSILSSVISKKRERPLLFCGCAPCQPFTKQRRVVSKNDERRSLLSEFQRFIEYWLPDYIFLENVPGLQKINKSDQVFKSFTDTLQKLKYKFDYETIKASDIGIPQVRQRFILIAARGACSILPINDIVEKSRIVAPTVRECIGDLPPISAGDKHPSVPNHVSASLSKLNLKRIKLTPEGGDRRDWPKKMMAGCHVNYKGHTDVYGRMKWDAPASTLTTRCISYSNGRFGHPEQDRAISVREAARLQTFPDSFIFYGSLISCAKQVGNAVPPLMAQKICESFK